MFRKNITKIVHRARALLELAATCGIVAASTVLVWNGVAAHRQTATPNVPGSRNTARPSVKIPDALISLEGAPIDGEPQARVAIIEFSDFQCPYCGAFARDTLPQLREKYLRTGKAVLAFRHLPLPRIHVFAEKASASAACANRQGRFWEMHDELFRNQQSLDVPSLRRFAAGHGLNMPQFDHCMADVTSNRVSDDSRIARALGIGGTPTFLIGTIDGNRRVKVLNVLTGSQPLSQFDAAIGATELPAQARARP